MKVIRNIGCLAQCKPEGTQADIHLLHKAAIVWQDDSIYWVGPQSQMPEGLTFDFELDAKNKLVLPGLIDCHTHLAFGGWRADEFEKRLLGKSYLDIARQGGGIQATVQETRRAAKAELLNKCRGFLEQMSRLGVTTVECKSGYGLSLKDEIKLLEVYQDLMSSQPLTIIPTFLGAHIIPEEYESRRSEYIDLLIYKMLPQVCRRNLARFCDVFIEETAYSVEEARKILNAAKKHGMSIKVHTDQFSDSGGSLLAAEMQAISAAHLERVSEHGIAAMAKQAVIGVILPLASLYTQQQAADARNMINRGLKLAVATDFNPGSAPSYDIHLAMMLACNLCGMTPAEAVKGATIYAAQAIDSANSVGSLEPGKRADFIVIDAPSVNHWLYNFRQNTCLLTVKNGKIIYQQQG
jgi:imidazolonepropionase